MSAYDLPPAPSRSTDDLIAEALDSVETVLALTADFDARQQQGPMIPIVNPALWEVGHVGWFFEKWTLRNLYEAQSMVPHSDALYDSAAIAHDTRWRLSFPSWEETRAFALKAAREATGRLRQGEPDALEQYFIQLATIHTDMHAEAFTYTRQTLGFPEPTLPSTTLPSPQFDFEQHDIAVPGGTFTLGAVVGELPFVFDNEKWGHEVHVEPFAIAATAVSNGEFLRFVESGGYRDRSCWTDVGWWWKQALGAEHPVYWRRESDGQVAGAALRRLGADRPARRDHPRELARGERVLRLGREAVADRSGVGAGGGWRRRRLSEAPVPVGRRTTDTRAREPRLPGPGHCRRARVPRRGHAPGLQADGGQRLGMDIDRVRAVPGVRCRPLQGVLRAGIQRTQGASRRSVEHAQPPDPQHLAELLHARPARRDVRVPHVRGLSRR